ncbi:MAG: hypothetical protein ACK4PI_05320 [Tepidisphaerales bacterium]
MTHAHSSPLGWLGALVTLTALGVLSLWTLRPAAPPAAPPGAPIGTPADPSARFAHAGFAAPDAASPAAADAHPLAFLDDPALLEQAKRFGFTYAVAPASNRSPEQIAAFNAASSCTACHTGYDTQHEQSMHPRNVLLTCTDCHGGDPKVEVPRDIDRAHPRYDALMKAAHPTPRLPKLWTSAANPPIPGAHTQQESPDYIRFVNPGDLHGAFAACLSCHESEVRTTRTSMMAHGAMLWGAALYNNGSINRKNAVYGEGYTLDGQPAKLLPTTWPSSPNGPTRDDVMRKGHLPYLLPLPRWNITQPGNILRVFERGGRRRPVLGIIDPTEDPGKLEVRLSIRGVGTDVRTDPVFIGLQKTRLLDPTLNLFGTNDHPGDYRASGCSACHVVYANDRSPVHSGPYAPFGNRGRTISKDPTISKDEPGHPIEHKFTSAVPSSQCMVCHVHPGTNVVNSYFGFQWWDNEVDGRHMYPARQKNPTEAQRFAVHQHNPEESAAKGLWGNLYPGEKSHAGRVAPPDFLENLTDLNPELRHTQFADFHGHGWVFRAVFKQDRHGNLLDVNGDKVQPTAQNMAAAVAFSTTRPALPPPGQPVHLKDIHLEKGMSCVDCHFAQDMHGDGNLYAETRAAIMEDCIDCHGSEREPAKILQYLRLPNRDRNSAVGRKLLLEAFSGPAARNGMTDEQIIARNRRIIEQHWQGRLDAQGRLVQVSAQKDDRGRPVYSWPTVQTVDTWNPDSWWSRDVGEGGGTHKDSPLLARFAHTVRKDGQTWGIPPQPGETTPQLALAHDSESMSCYSCHTSWTTACFGCHLPQRANLKKDVLHYEAEPARNYTNYNFQTLRDDVFMLGIDSTVKGHKIVPVRSSCAVLVSSKDALRQWVYSQQQTVSAEGFSGQAFSVYFPHTVRSIETKRCTDCHISQDNNNNAWLAHITLQGSNSVNFIGRYAYVAAGRAGLEAVVVTERDEPQAVIGSRLHELAYPDNHRKHLENQMRLTEAYRRGGREVLDVQLRGEYVYAACGSEGFFAFDVAMIDNKGYSQRIVTAPVSPLGQRFYVKTRYATSVVSPSTMALDPTRPQHPDNEEQKIHLLYAFLYVTDAYEGLVVIGNRPGTREARRHNVGVATLLDGDPENNFLSKALSFNPGGALNGAVSMTLHGTLAYLCVDRGVAVVDLDNPLEPKLLTTLPIPNARKVATQLRYGWVATADGLVTLDLTDPRNPRVVEGAALAIPGARDIYVSRTYGYVAAGRSGVAIVDLERPDRPALVELFTAGGAIVDAHQVKVGMTNASMFAYVADGVGGLKVLQLTSPDDTPTFSGFSPRPAPRLIATYATAGPALAISEGLERDRAVDESGNQLAVFGRRGARPFNLAEVQRLLYVREPDGTLTPRRVSDRPDPGNPPLSLPAPAATPTPTETPAAPATRPAGGRPAFPGRR